MRVAIIGSGVAGMVSTHFLKKEFPEATIIVFEVTDNIGGTWNYKDGTGDGEFELPSMTSMYKNLRTNLPKEIMAFSDFPIPESYRTFMSDEEYLTYLHDYAKHFDLAKHVKYRHLVTSVKVIDEGWEVGYRDLRGGRTLAQKFDYVYVCNGHYNRAFVPEYKGQNIFRGGQVHSHDYRKPEYYKDKTVLIVGAGPSAQDISIDVARCCKKLYMAHHSPKFPSPYPKHFEQRPDIKELTATSVIFSDDTLEDIDEVLYCTGYAYYCPFLDNSCGLVVHRTHIDFLYRHVVNVAHPTMFFIGVPQLCCAVPLMDMQARYTVAVIKGDFKLPSKDGMMDAVTKAYEDRKRIGRKKQDTHLLAEHEASYFLSMAQESGVKPVPKVFCDIRMSTMQTKVNLYIYRNYKYKIIDDNTFVRTYAGETIENGIENGVEEK